MIILEFMTKKDIRRRGIISFGPVLLPVFSQAFSGDFWYAR